jgi:hypothetical protein
MHMDDCLEELAFVFGLDFERIGDLDFFGLGDRSGRMMMDASIILASYEASPLLIDSSIGVIGVRVRVIVAPH